MATERFYIITQLILWIGILVGMVLLLFYVIDLVNKQVEIQVNECDKDKLYISEINNNLAVTIKNHIDTKNYDCNCNLKCPKYELDSFSAVLKQNANIRRYELNVYDCTEFAKGLSADLNNLEMPNEIVMVRINCDLWADAEGWLLLEQTYGYGYSRCKKNPRHEIVCIPNESGICIESTTGEFIMPKDRPKYNLK